MDKYKIIDNYLSISDYQRLWDTVRNAPYTSMFPASAVDGSLLPVGMTSNLQTDLFPTSFGNAKLERCYINYYGPSEWAHFHIDDEDDESLTLLYYPTPNYPIDEGGCTEFLIDDEIVGVRPICNRAVIFKGNIYHRAAPFKTKARYTVALKYITPERYVAINQPTVNYGS